MQGYFHRINFVGGEPTISPNFIPLVKRAKQLGFEVSMVTNGFNLCKDSQPFDAILPEFSMIGLSVDSLNPDSNLKIGRAVKNSVLTKEEYISLCKKIKSWGCKLKINTVVNKINLNEDFNEFFSQVNPDRIKFFQVLKPNYKLKHNYDDLLITQTEYDNFVKKHSNFSKIICSENNEAMLNAYYILDNDGCFLDNKSCKMSRSLVDNELSEVLKDITVNQDKYLARYSI